ncbi:MAG: hypothetical protein ACI9I0_001106 [Rhodoferax sp.]|jgi:hypothetical protein
MTSWIVMLSLQKRWPTKKARVERAFFVGINLNYFSFISL